MIERTSSVKTTRTFDVVRDRRELDLFVEDVAAVLAAVSPPVAIRLVCLT